MRVVLSAAGVAAIAALLLASAHPKPGKALWPGSRFTLEQRDQAIMRGLDFLYNQIARDPDAFVHWGHDLLFAFGNIAATSSDPALQQRARDMGHERALEWNRLHPSLPPGYDESDIGDLVSGLDSVERLAAPNPKLRQQLEAAAPRFSAVDYLWFDPKAEGPPADIPELCGKCKRQNDRGAIQCIRCGARLTMRSRYDIYQDALITSYTGERTRIVLGARYRDVLKWLPTLRPYPPPGSNWHEYYAGIYAITHVVYTYNEYSQYRISQSCFPREFDHLRAHLRQAASDQDPETMGEFLDSLRAFGLDFNDRLIRTGIEYLLGSQNRDGSWGEQVGVSTYSRYHPTWTAIDGLRDYRWEQVLPCAGL
jgi:hypothetical protein